MATEEEEEYEMISQTATDEDGENAVDVVMRMALEVYNNKYYWMTFKSAVFFFFGLKVAQECYHVVIPMKEYEPFNVCGRCR